MITSPIKTTIRNLSGKRYSFDFGYDAKVVLLPHGSSLDTAVIDGDAFSLFTDSREADSLVHGIIRGELKVSYSIEPVYEVNKVAMLLQASTINLTNSYRQWAGGKQSQKADITVEPVTAAPIEEKPAAVTEIIQESIVEYAPVEEVKQEEPVAEAEAIEPVEPVKEDQAEPQEAPAVEEAPKKRNRRVKLS